MTSANDSADSENAVEPDTTGRTRSGEVPRSSESLPGRAWLTLILFAAFVVFTSGCMINLLTR